MQTASYTPIEYQCKGEERSRGRESAPRDDIESLQHDIQPFPARLSSASAGRQAGFGLCSDSIEDSLAAGKAGGFAGPAASRNVRAASWHKPAAIDGSARVHRVRLLLPGQRDRGAVARGWGFEFIASRQVEGSTGSALGDDSSRPEDSEANNGGSPWQSGGGDPSANGGPSPHIQGTRRPETTHGIISPQQSDRCKRRCD